MFTGIVTDVGDVRATEERGDLRLVIGCGYDLSDVALGASIACSGVCLTVVDKGADWFAVDVSGETISKSAGDPWRGGARLNLERAMKIGDELGGHIVTGHVDGVGTVVDRTADGDSVRFTIAVPPDLAPYLAAKGSVTVDGVSLTVNAIVDQSDGSTHFALNIIPHTQAVTTLGALEPGQTVNIEIDVLARYLKRMEQYRGQY